MASTVFTASFLVVDNLRERLPTGSVAQCIQPRIAANTRRKIRPIGLAQRLDQCVTTLLTDLAVSIPATLIQPRIALFSALRHQLLSYQLIQRRNHYITLCHFCKRQTLVINNNMLLLLTFAIYRGTLTLVRQHERSSGVL